jgi:hypothetical protein
MSNNGSRDQIKQALQEIVEMFDDKIPYIGMIMDIPIVDKIEKETINKVVDVLFDENTNQNDPDTFMMWSA